jgi:uncharacterized UBP type Zn finger protein
MPFLHNHDPFTEPDGRDVAGPLNLYNYELFAVVSHEGQIDNGHYTCYARSQDEVGLSVAFSAGSTISDT